MKIRFEGNQAAQFLLGLKVINAAHGGDEGLDLAVELKKEIASILGLFEDHAKKCSAITSIPSSSQFIEEILPLVQTATSSRVRQGCEILELAIVED